MLNITYPDGSKEWQGNPLIQGDSDVKIWSWSWVMRRDLDPEEDPLVAGEFELKEGGRYTTEFWINVEDGKPDGIFPDDQEKKEQMLERTIFEVGHHG